jgi:hypothetical protein
MGVDSGAYRAVAEGNKEVGGVMPVRRWVDRYARVTTAL